MHTLITNKFLKVYTYGLRNLNKFEKLKDSAEYLRKHRKFAGLGIFQQMKKDT